MDQGDAAVWAAGLGIAGTLLGALGGAAVQGWYSRRHARDQEAANVRHWLREQRRAAYAEFLLRADAATKALTKGLSAQRASDSEDYTPDSQIADVGSDALGQLELAAADVTITGPQSMHELASSICHECGEAFVVLILREDLLSERRRAVLQTLGTVHEARKRFVTMANAVLSGADE